MAKARLLILTEVCLLAHSHMMTLTKANMFRKMELTMKERSKTNNLIMVHGTKRMGL